MNFNQDDYTENIDYCEYVFNKNKAFAPKDSKI